MGHSVTFQLKDIDILLDFQPKGDRFMGLQQDFQHNGNDFRAICEIIVGLEPAELTDL